MKKFLTLFSLVPLFSLSASVWQEQNYWNQDYETQFRQWVQGPEVHPQMFKTGAYRGIKADCADVVYALRAIFAFENKLPFQYKNPVYRNGGKHRYFSNQMNKWDSTRNPIQRLVKFVNFMGNTVGTEQLSLNDSFPVQIKSVQKGHFYMYKVKSKGQYIRHAYQIKDVLPVGTFDLIYSTQARRRDGKPLGLKQNQMLYNRPLYAHWGFKQFRWPEHYQINDGQLPSFWNYSTDQYELAQQMTEKEFFQYVKNQLKTRDELPEDALRRGLNSLCSQLKDRIEVVQGAVQFAANGGGRCMNYSEYDTYSTPNRDRKFRKTFADLQESYQEIVSSGVPVDLELLEKVAKIYESGYEQVEDYCPQDYTSNGKITLATLYRRYQRGVVSYHPNDNIHRRWGDLIGTPTTCRAFYD